MSGNISTSPLYAQVSLCMWLLFKTNGGAVVGSHQNSVVSSATRRLLRTKLPPAGFTKSH